MNGFPLTVVAVVAFLGGFGRPVRQIRGCFHDSRHMRWISLISVGLYKGGFHSLRWISWISLFRQWISLIRQWISCQ